ncbi:MAG: hypothetical protein RIR51_2073 [Bacteroidota bacterium]|jgi:myosin heavy subunit
MENQNKNSKVGLIALAAIAAILAVLYFRSVQSNNEKELELEKTVIELSETTVKLDSISAQLDAKIAEIQSLGGEVEDLMAIKAQLEKDKKSLLAGNLSMKSKIAEYESILTEKDALIEELKKENGILTENNQVLTSKNENLNSENTNLKSDNASLSQNLEKTQVENQELTNTVKIGAQLKAINLQVSAINSKGKADVKAPFRSKRIESIRVSFNLAKNPITKLENKKIYLRILDPSGSIIADNAAGSGNFLLNGKETIYTATVNAKYTKDEPSVSISFNKGGMYAAGTYAIELYSEGFTIGTGSFIVK